MAGHDERTFDLREDTWYLDARYLGTPQLIATGVLETPAGLLLIDPGPSTCVDNLLAALAERQSTLSDVAAILLTHIHLDHAGATGTLVARNRRIRVFVHRRGAPHVANPSRLVRSASQIYGDRMEELWGEVAPVPDDNVEALQGGELIAPGGRDIEVAYTPGHAIHHVSYFDRASGTAFVGDTTGMHVSGTGYVVPVTPPPDIDVDVWPDSLKRIRRWAPERLFLTHFGPVEDADKHLVNFEAALHDWAVEAQRHLEQYPDPAEGAIRFRSSKLAEMADNLPPDVLPLYERFGDPGESYRGLARYWQRRTS